MKMSDVFDLPVDVMWMKGSDGEVTPYKDSLYVSHAINNHDQLTEELELLKMKYAAVCDELEYTSKDLSKSEFSNDVSVLIDNPTPMLARYGAELLRKAAFKIGRLVVGESDYAKGFNDGVDDKNRIIEDMAKELERSGK